MTKRASPIFTVKQYVSGQPWICIEYATVEPGIPSALYGFDLPDGTNHQKALEIAQYMQDNLGAFTYTKLP